MPAGLPGVINLVYGVPSEISEYLIPHPVIRKTSFTGSTAVGKQLAAIAGAHMKRVTMELGGHAPSIVFDDADVDLASRLLSTNKLRNGGEVCVSPTRLLCARASVRELCRQLHRGCQSGEDRGRDGKRHPDWAMAHPRRFAAMGGFIGDAVQKGASLRPAAIASATKAIS